MMRQQKGQSSFELLLLVAFVLSVSVTVIAGYFEITPGLFGTALVKSTLLREITINAPETVIVSVDYQKANGINEFNVKTTPDALPCNRLNWSDQTPDLFQSANDSLVRLNNCESALVKANVFFEIPAGKTVQEVIQACQDEGLVPSLDVNTTPGVVQRIVFDMDPGVEQYRLVSVDSGSPSLTATFTGDCCLSFNGTYCVNGGYNVNIIQTRLGSIWSNESNQSVYHNETTHWTFPSP